MSSFLSNLDFFPKYKDDVKVKTLFGASVSIVALLIMIFLFISEFYDYLSIKVENHLTIDNTESETLQINFNLTFPKIPCTLISVDIMDLSGDRLDVNSNGILKTKIDKDGNRLGVLQKIEPGGTLKEDNVLDEVKAHNLNDSNIKGSYCGSCYGAQDFEGQCCNTCDSIKVAYHKKGWALSDISRFEQCQKEGQEEKADKTAMESGEGCNIAGFVETKKGQGNFHFAPGHSFSEFHSHMHDFGAFQSGQFDTSHIIHHLSFGQDLDGKTIHNPLDDTKHFSSFEGSSIFQYYTKVVPTRFKRIDGSQTLTNQYSVTMHETKLKLKEGYGIPGIFFFYEFSPLMADIYETRKPFSHFITQVCAIVGGVFTVTGLLDRLVYGTMKSFKTKMQLGKLK